MSAAITDFAPNHYGNPVRKKALSVGLLVSSIPFISALAGHQIGSGWGALFLAFAPFILCALAYIWVTYSDTTPGIKNDGIVFGQFTGRGLAAIMLGIVLTGLYVTLYWFPQYLGLVEWGKPAVGAIFLLEPLSQALRGTYADQWFLYGFLYTVGVSVMGARMLYRYRHNKYQILRTLSVMFFQFAFGFILPGLLKAFSQPEFYFTYFWPLKSEYLFPSKWSEMMAYPGGLGTLMLVWGVVASFVLTPTLTYWFGKRWYCSWVCGCGGLAETAGDPFRQLSSKKLSAWKFERWSIHSVLVLITVLTVLLWIDLGEFSQSYKKAYGFGVGSLLSGVVGVGFYPLLGSRIWCRFFCPMAAVLGIFQRFFSRFRITTNGDQCISCGNCSMYCEMGIDVRAYAMQGKNIIRASCVGCGICAAVCPRGVLKLENGKTHADRFDGADNPLAELMRSLSGHR